MGYLCFSVIPWISLTVRRLRDAGKSGWWTLLVLVVGIGAGNSSFNPVYNEVEAVYGPPEMFDPSLNEPEEVYGPPEMLDPAYNPDDELNDEPIVDPADVKEDIKEDVEEESTEEFDEKRNMEVTVYGPPEMMNGSNESESKTEEKSETKSGKEVEGQMTLDDLDNQEEK